MSRNDLCGLQLQKAACAPLCSRAVAKPDWFHSGAQSAEPESFSLCWESHSIRSWILMKLSTCLSTAWNWRILVLRGAKSQIWVGCLINAFWCVLIPTPSHGKSAGSLAWRLSTSSFGVVLSFLFPPDLISTCRSYFLFLMLKHLSQLFILSLQERHEKTPTKPKLLFFSNCSSNFHLNISADWGNLMWCWIGLLKETCLWGTVQWATRRGIWGMYTWCSLKLNL